MADVLQLILWTEASFNALTLFVRHEIRLCKTKTTKPLGFPVVL